MDLVEERERTHGPFSRTAVMAQALKAQARSGTNWVILPAEIKEAIENDLSKLARILEGNFAEVDHYRDRIGYNHLSLRALAAMQEEFARTPCTEMCADQKMNGKSAVP